MNLTKIQIENREWVLYNFPKSSHLWEPALGIAEEAGELCHAVLKQYQGIRGDQIEAIKDAVGDIAIYLLDFCNKAGLNFEECVQDTWSQVKQRDWIQYPINGISE